MELQIDAEQATTEVATEAEAHHPSSDIAPRNGKKPSRVNLPGYTYAELISMAIQSAPSRMMTIVEIQKFMRDSYPCFRTSYKGWHNSIRHNLSARECFYKVPIIDKRQKCRTHYWMINPNCSHCLDGNGLLQEARQWRNRRVMAKTVVRKKRRASKKNGSSMTRNADGLNARVVEQESANPLLYRALTSRTPPMHPMEYTQQRSPDQFTNSQHTVCHHSTDRGFPLTYLPRDQPACLACGDDMAGDCEHCVLLEVDEEPPSPMPYSTSTSNYMPMRSESVEMTSQTLYHFKTYMKEEPNIQELDVKKGAVLDDIVDKQDLFQTDDNFDASVYDVEGHLAAHQHPGTIGSTMPTSMPPSTAPSSPTQYPLDLSYQHTRCHSSHAKSETLPDLIKHQPHPSLSCTDQSSYNYCKEMNPYFFQDRGYNFVQHDRHGIDHRCHVADPTKRFYRFPSDEFLSDTHKSGRVAATVDMSKHRPGFLRRSEDERRGILHGYLFDKNCNSLLIEPIHHRTCLRLPTNNSAHRFTLPVDSTSISFNRGTPSRFPLDNNAPRRPACTADPSRLVPRSNVNSLLGFGGGITSSAVVAASNDTRTMSSLGELLKVSMVITSQHDFRFM